MKGNAPPPPQRTYPIIRSSLSLVSRSRISANVGLWAVCGGEEGRGKIQGGYQSKRYVGRARRAGDCLRAVRAGRGDQQQGNGLSGEGRLGGGSTALQAEEVADTID